MNGHIITINDRMPSADAMFVENGIIKAIGSMEDVTPHITVATRSVNLNGKAVMPGFIDPHTHFALSMFLSEAHDLSGFTNENNHEVWKSLKEKAQTTEKGEWIICSGIDPILIDDLIIPTLPFLDTLVPDHPLLLLSQSLHNYWVNSRALAKSGITNGTPDPSAQSFYAKDSSGNLSGLIVEQEAIRPVMDLLEKEVMTPEFYLRSASQVMSAYAKNGNTTLVTTGLTVSDKRPLILLQHLSDKNPSFLSGLLGQLGRLPMRRALPRHFVYIRHDRTDLLPERRRENDFYNIIGIKHWMDGSPYIGTMYLNDPYLDTHVSNELLHIPRLHRGEALIEHNELSSFIRNNHLKGWQIAIHSQGDAAISQVLDAFEEVNQDVDIQSGRHRLEHCLLLPEFELDRIKKLNISPSFHINHLYYYGDALEKDLLGEIRSSRMLPVATTQKRGIVFSLHADQPMFESKPFRLIQTAVERRTRSGKLIGEEQKVILMEALKALTIHAAWQIHMEDKIGSLEEGKYADFIILDQNPFTVPSGELEKIKCLETYVHGNRID
jgi:predicted amidohydrolase YtcJ